MRKLFVFLIRDSLYVRLNSHHKKWSYKKKKYKKIRSEHIRNLFRNANTLSNEFDQFC